jgi:hypothetical protein
MGERVVGTGVELRLPSRPDEHDQHAAPPAGEIPVVAQVFVEVEDVGRRYRVGGTTVLSSGYGIAPGSDPTTDLVRIAYETREEHLGDLLGDMRMGGCDVTRFEFYAAPFEIELAAPLREALAGSWRDRPPH